MTCEQMGGPCGYKISANTPKEMMEEGMEHLKESHPDISRKMETMSAEENKDWNDSFLRTWEITPNIM